MKEAMTGKQAYIAMLRDQIGPALRRYGFRGSGTNWILTAANGDRAIVNAQSSDGSTQARVIFVLNMAVVPLPWWNWSQEYYGASMPRTPKAYHGLWEERLHARRETHDRGTERWWAVTDEDSAGQCATDIIELFEHAIPNLAALLDRETMKRTLRSRDLGFAKGPKFQKLFDHALAILLADEGPSDELEALVAELDTQTDARFVTWLQTRATGVRNV